MFVRRIRKRVCSQRRGIVAVLVAISLGALMAVLALTVDGGRLYDARRQSQMAADAAADAGAMDLYASLDESGTDPSASVSRAIAAAYAVAEVNGFDNDGKHSTVEVYCPPRTGSRAGQTGFIEVQIEKKLSRCFSGIFGKGSLSVHGRAVAAGTQIATRGSILVLESKKKHAMSLKGSNSRVEATGDIIVNSRSPKALKVSKHGQAQAEHFLLAGGVDRKSRGMLEGEVQTGVVPTPDPLAGLPVPPTSTARDVNDYLQVINGRRNFRLPPGTYHDLEFDKDDVVVMEPEIITVNGNLSFKGNSSLTAIHTTIYHVGKKSVKLDTRGEITLIPPTEGTYRDISLFQSRTSKKKVQFRKSGHLDIRGIVYAPNAEVKFNHIQNGVLGLDLQDEEDNDDEDDVDPVGGIDDGGADMNGSIGASIISRKLKIDKHSQIKIFGDSIAAQRRFLGVVE